MRVSVHRRQRLSVLFRKEPYDVGSNLRFQDGIVVSVYDHRCEAQFKTRLRVHPSVQWCRRVTCAQVLSVRRLFQGLVLSPGHCAECALRSYVDTVYVDQFQVGRDQRSIRGVVRAITERVVIRVRVVLQVVDYRTVVERSSGVGLIGSVRPANFDGRIAWCAIRVFGH